MLQHTNATAERIGGREPATRQEAALLDVRAVAAILDCSPRHIARLVETGRMPQPVKLGRLCRWCRAAVEVWVRDGCPPCKESAQ